MLLNDRKEQLTNQNLSNLKLDYDLAIVGGGIVGATLACALKNSGLKVVLIEAKSLEMAAAKRQAYALSLLSGKILKGIGVWDQIFPHISKFRHIRLSDGTYPEIVKFEKEDLGTNFLGYVAEHKVVLTALQEFLSQSDDIKCLCPAEVVKINYEKSRAEIEVKQGETLHKISTKLVIGADGRESRIRQQVGIKTKGWKYWQSCVAFTVKHEAPVNDIAFERFWPTGPMGVLPLSENRCQIVWSNPHERAKSLLELDEKDFLNELEFYTGGLLGKLELVSNRYLFPVKLMQCDRYILPRLALMGDAAHCCHPVGGQGLNLGIRDAAVLAEILLEADQKGEDIGDIAVLKRYSNWRKSENLGILGFTDFLTRMFSNQFLPVVILRRFGLWMMQRVSFIKIFALKLMTGLKGRTPILAKD